MTKKNEKAILSLDRILTGHNVMRKDGWLNVATGLGNSRDKRMYAQFSGTRRFWQREELEDMFYSNDLFATVIELPPREETREWLEFRTPGDFGDEGFDPELGKQIEEWLEEFAIKRKVREARTWARLHGGSLMILGIDDGQSMDKPVRENRIRNIDWIEVVDRWDVMPEVIDPRGSLNQGFSPDPEFYTFLFHENLPREITDLTTSTRIQTREFRIHKSRVIRFDGMLTSRRRKAQNNGWGEPVLSRVYDVLRDFGMAFDGAAHLTADFAQAVYQIKGLSKMLAADKDGLVLKRLMALDMCRSVSRAIPIDMDESFERKATPVAGLPDLLDRFILRLSAATRIPVNLLMGRSPAGLNATGESDLRNFYDYVRSEQEDQLRPPLERLFSLMFKARRGPTNGKEPEDWSFVFRPLWVPNEQETSIARETLARADALYLDRGVVTPEEVARSRFGGDRFGMELHITDEPRQKPLEQEMEIAGAGGEELPTVEGETQAPAPQGGEGEGEGGGQAAQASGGGLVTVRAVADSVGFKGSIRSLGTAISRAYKRETGKNPGSTRERNSGGVVRNVKAYPADFRARMEELAREMIARAGG